MLLLFDQLKVNLFLRSIRCFWPQQQEGVPGSSSRDVEIVLHAQELPEFSGQRCAAGFFSFCPTALATSPLRIALDQSVLVYRKFVALFFETDHQTQVVHDHQVVGRGNRIDNDGHFFNSKDTSIKNRSVKKLISTLTRSLIIWVNTKYHYSPERSFLSNEEKLKEQRTPQKDLCVENVAEQKNSMICAMLGAEGPPVHKQLARQTRCQKVVSLHLELPNTTRLRLTRYSIQIMNEWISMHYSSQPFVN